jgi:hypothetical protein
LSASNNCQKTNNRRSWKSSELCLRKKKPHKHHQTFPFSRPPFQRGRLGRGERLRKEGSLLLLCGFVGASRQPEPCLFFSWVGTRWAVRALAIHCPAAAKGGGGCGLWRGTWNEIERHIARTSRLRNMLAAADYDRHPPSRKASVGRPTLSIHFSL